MSKKQDAVYFQTFVACVEHACKAAQILDESLQSYHPETLRACLDKLHNEEHAADMKKHQLMELTARAFITPIEREDIVLLSNNIDELVDRIEDVLIRMYCDNIQAVRPDVLKVTKILMRCCQEVKLLMIELENFKRSKTLRSHIVEINRLEAEADRLFIQSLRTLHTTSTDPVEILCWRELYYFFEKCVDACEHIADAVEMVVMKNS